MTVDYDVAIIGCGPVGAYAANLMGRAGLKTLVVDRDTSPYALPRAVHFDHEMLRLLEDVDLLEPISDRILAADGHLHIGADHGVIRFMSAAGLPRPYGYANDYFFYQPELEEVLRSGLSRHPHVTLQLGREFVGIVQGADLATLSFADGQTVTARWVLGTDGARSAVRKAIGVKLDDLKFEEPWLVVDAEVEGPISFPDLTGVPDGANLQRLSVMMCDPARPATIVPGRGNHRRWEFMLLPGEDDAVMAMPENVKELVQPWVKGAEHEIIRAATYRFHGLVAESWWVGRTFLAGDAAHQTPPFFGQGMCHGMRDVANLAWKLALVCQGKATESLLETYQQERDRQVRHVIGQAVEAGRYICVLDPQEARERDERIRSTKGMRTAAELIAPLQSDIIASHAGERFINPKIAEDGALLDSKTGGGWVVLSATPVDFAPDSAAVLAQLHATQMVLGDDVQDLDGHLENWFETKNAVIALVRPDFYVAVHSADQETFSNEVVRLGEAMALEVRPGMAAAQ
ncbi:bifunctional 3-(3-hydroxy-phenyl)propionate/3-hydroxycinnamic acid hydroxylase [Rhizobium sp. L1K21]|uniref:bifunctional 3-(3-hydroxy-phenyl)propionate/3-hydroxycinnamic acid hydroxylase n=1 Tax=Rhizobium sp. L1K21 TaxID=2954933 RepID=UPI0020935518|nr:bifunctional 3-(3-hydroxy-phenyl)propionate/3-hydroxycinnamic acid hydroxylase [Rhizobium sp. L1K21]MCO6188438.1 bifunctional 3-(3-hydroxy-phenyl)propionate/3-hydroxycinnamic acid hydroxylase [Rhizobium sp. L1K21]